MIGFNPLFFVGLAVLFCIILWSYWEEWRVTKDRPPEGRLIKTKFGSLHLIERGEKEEVAGSGNRGIRPLVMIHGSTTNALDMDIELVGRLEEGRSLFLPDRPGHGFSDRPKDGWRLDVQAAAIREALREAGVEDPIILGQSYGGAIALRYALDYGDEISGLVLVAPVTHRWPGGVAWYNRIAINPLYGWLFRRSFIALYSRYGAKRGALRALRGAAFASRYFDRTRVAMTFRPSKFYNNAEDIVRLYEQLVAMDTRYHEIPVPTEIVTGTHDMTVITSVHGRALAKQIPNAALKVINGGGHALHHTHPEETVAAIMRLEDRIASAQRSPLQGALKRLSAVFPSPS